MELTRDNPLSLEQKVLHPTLPPAAVSTTKAKVLRPWRMQRSPRDFIYWSRDCFGHRRWPTTLVPMTSYPLSLPSETLPSLPSPPARSSCDLRLPATSQRILPPFAETPPTSPFHSATSFALPNSQPRGLHPSASCPRLRLRYIFAPTLYPTLLAP